MWFCSWIIYAGFYAGKCEHLCRGWKVWYIAVFGIDNGGGYWADTRNRHIVWMDFLNQPVNFFFKNINLFYKGLFLECKQAVQFHIKNGVIHIHRVGSEFSEPQELLGRKLSLGKRAEFVIGSRIHMCHFLGWTIVFEKIEGCFGQTFVKERFELREGMVQDILVIFTR